MLADVPSNAHRSARSSCSIRLLTAEDCRQCVLGRSTHYGVIIHANSRFSTPSVAGLTWNAVVLRRI